MGDTTFDWLSERLPEAEIRTRLDQIHKEMDELRRSERALRAALFALEVAASENGAAMASPRVGPPTRKSPISARFGQDSSRPGLTDAVRILLSEAPGHMLSTKELIDDLTARDWLPEAKDIQKTVGATLSRMAHRTGELERLGRGRYRLREPESERDQLTGRLPL